MRKQRAKLKRPLTGRSAGTKPEVQPGFFIAWIVGTLVAGIFGFAAFYAILTALGARGVIPFSVASILMTLCCGLVIALAEWAVLRRYMRTSGLWFAATLLAFLIAIRELLSLSGQFGPAITLLDSLLIGFVLGGFMGVAQWATLRGRVGRRDLLWNVISLVAWIVISLVAWIMAGLAGTALQALDPRMPAVLYWPSFFFAGTVLSTVGMIWLLAREPGARPDPDLRLR